MIKHVLQCQIRFVTKAKRAYINQTAMAACSFPAWLGATPLILASIPLCFLSSLTFFRRRFSVSRVRFCSLAALTTDANPRVGLSLRSPPVETRLGHSDASAVSQLAVKTDITWLRRQHLPG